MKPLRIAVLISGAGSTLKNLIQWKARGELPVEIATVISTREDAGGLQYARDADIPTELALRSDSGDPQAYSKKIFDLCRKRSVGLVVMAGFVQHVLIPDDFNNRVVNIHPALIPAFCGKGFYGMRVHRAVIEYGAKLSGCTVHFVDNEYDHGPIIAQRSCAVFDMDTPESLCKRVGELECQLYPEAIAAIARDQITVEGRHVHVRAMV